ncbi:hypothetical protein BDY17DRAFT_303302 [Neohortaea acidophila]|uniref:UBC core domain-containing protein n=1 Tax=Neohortaea acidophila TaxID=245834 RepID=A0A6A6PJH0_9PEZI|nr:uncharacterized protein BDY17DRAFT_303302 [Neohortaea acidophila]KAF2480142.1 hypothetical protein BDY17DRAFT_303302 [Neohortaea acidophila]
MPRRQFIADLQSTQDGQLPPGIHDLQRGEDDGQLVFLFAINTPSRSSTPVKLNALIPELSEYPRSHEYIIYAEDGASTEVADALDGIRRTSGKTVFELLEIVSTTLSRLFVDTDGDVHMPDSEIDDAAEEEDDDDDDADVYDSDHEAFQTSTAPSASFTVANGGVRNAAAGRAFRQRVRQDLRAAKQAGFKVGVLGHLLDGYNAFVTMSIRMSKLGISDEAMQAWRVEASEYLILVLQYPNGYKTSEELQGFDSLRLEPNIGMRVCTGKMYKPTLQEAIKAFTTAKKDGRDSIADSLLANADGESPESSIRDVFISKPLNGLLKERLVAILRFRGMGMGWTGAEDLYISRTSAGATKTDVVDDSHFLPEPTNDALPDIVNADHWSEKSGGQMSFPLLAMQFLLRHFVRCTEFCLVCHRKMNTELEAIKPYVCESDFCLYQYMAIGFGPSIEHEISSQPYVVDLLVSFCYNSAASHRLREFPDGLSLVVPPVDPKDLMPLGPATPKYRGRQEEPEEKADKAGPRPPAVDYEVGFDQARLEIIFHIIPEQCPVKKGDWIVLQPKGTLEGSELHCRIREATFFPTISINEPVLVRRLSANRAPDGGTTTSIRVVTDTPLTPHTVTPAQTPKWAPAGFQVYSQDFKSLTKEEKSAAICRLLDTLPNVKTLQEYLKKRASPDLADWNERISTPALSILRWIIASNRACIMQVDGDDSGAGSARQEERLYGMRDYMQFRFAMGAPDKEQRFINEVRKTATRLKLAYPTLFAWHGSPLYNWHTIIREGLHYKNVDHGRAYGDGVYHALDAQTSTGYSGMHGGYANGNARGSWPNSLLEVSAALALNEIVNAPAEFQSQKPYYVVKQLDWIQTRYLFVRCGQKMGEIIKLAADEMPKTALIQDPQHIPRGANGGPIRIPASAIKSSRIFKNERRPELPSPAKRLKAMGGFDDPIPIDDDDAASVVTTTSDLIIMFEDDPELEDASSATSAAPKKIEKPPGTPTDFLPGTLDFSKLPLMPMPTYATSATTKRLMKELQAVAKAQELTPAGDLGWYIDVEQIENVYQWIVELHSFHTFEIKGKKLPLADDMKKQDVKSIVLEIRFNKDFPFTPPYVRVIRPRFLTMLQGGGGHIVAGGAMCMELLTNTGWSSVSSMESVLMQVRLAIASEPFARLDTRSRGEYGTGEAADGYVRACNTHGWQIPPGFKEMAYESALPGKSD